jgi:hypothetical protein
MQYSSASKSKNVAEFQIDSDELQFLLEHVQLDSALKLNSFLAYASVK